MKEATPTLLPLLRTRSQGDILAHVLLSGQETHSATQIARALGLSVPTVTREVQRLVDAGLLLPTKQGNTRLLTVNTDHPAHRPLVDLMLVTFGPLPVLRNLLAQVPGVERAFIYGSWADRYAGNPGPAPGDIDVLVVGNADRVALDDAVEEAERVLRREVNVRRVSAKDWQRDDSPFRRTVESRPTVDVISADEHPTAS